MFGLLSGTAVRAEDIRVATLQPADKSPALQAVPPVIAPEATSFDLANGLKVVVIPDRRAPVVTHMVWYKVGAADEPMGKSGIAHYLEHLMFKGTRANPGATFSKAVAAVGGQENAFTSSDYTGYFQRVAKEHLSMVMALEADRMEGLVLDDATARPELKVVLEERSQRTDNNPSAQFSEALEAALFVSSPYRIPIIGWRHEIEKLTYRDALDFYNQWYTPNNAILVIAGDVELADVKALAEKTYGQVKRRFEVKDRARPVEPPPLARRMITFADERVTQASLNMAWLAPSRRTARPGQSEAIDLLCEVIGGGSNSRLYRELVVEKSLAASVGCWYQPGAYDDTKLMIYGTPADNVSLETLRSAIDGIVTELAKAGVTEDELARAKRRLIATAVHAQDSQSALARLFGASLTTGETLDSVKTWPARVMQSDATAVRAAGEAIFAPERLVTGFLISAPPSGKARAAKAAWPVAGPGAGGAIRMTEATDDTDDSEAAE